MLFKSKNAEIYKEILEREPEDYSSFRAEALESFCQMKDGILKQYTQRLVNALDVIDQIAEFLNLNDKGLSLYDVDEDGTSPLLNRLKEYIEKGGDKVKLKKRINELENENAVLRSLIEVRRQNV